MRIRLVPRAAAGLVLLVCAAGPVAAAQGPIYAVGDIHGDLGAFETILRHTGLLDAEGDWSGDTAVLVQTGDFLDRGAEVRGVMDRLRRLGRQAQSAGGGVVQLVGNHEAMNLLGEYRDVSRAAYASFADERSRRRQREAYKSWQRFWRERTAELGYALPETIARTRREWLEEHPEGYLEYLEAIGPEGEYGRWLRGLAVAETVGSTLFVHGGLAPPVERTPADLNPAFRLEIERFDLHRRRLAELGVTLPFFDRVEIFRAIDFTLAAGEAAGGAETPLLAEIIAIRKELALHHSEGVGLSPAGPLWYRGYAQLAPADLLPVLERTFEALGVERVVAGHTPSPGASIVARLDGRIYLIDTGMQPLVNPRGRPAALEIAGDVVTAIYPDDREILAPAAAAKPVGGGGFLLAPTAEPQVEEDPPPTPRPRTFYGPDGALPFADHDEIVDFLETAEVIGVEEIGQGVTRPKRLTLERDGVVARAVFHDVDLRERAKLLPGKGFVADFSDSYRNQVAGYRVSRMLGLDLVPPAALRTVEGVEGSVGLWIENAMDERQRLERKLQPPDLLRWQRRFHDMRVFDNLIHNIDRNQTNILVDDQWRIWFIDTTRAFGTGVDLSYEKNLLRCSRGLWRAIRELDREQAKQELGDLLSGVEIRALIKRRDRVVGYLERRMGQVGSDRVLFDYGAPADNVTIRSHPESPPPPER